MNEYLHERSKLDQQLRSIGYKIPEGTIVKPYWTKYTDRIIFLLRSRNLPFVVKICPFSQEAEREAKHFLLLQGSFRFSGAKFPTSSSQKLERSNYHVLTMPWVGNSFIDLSIELYEGEYSINNKRPVFRGFTSNEITRLINSFRRDHVQFAQKYRIIHGDIFPGTPNNIMYHPRIQHLFPIDAEALAPLNTESYNRFLNQVDALESWMHENLLQV